MEIVKPEYKYSELTGLIIKCSMAVHTALGNGFQEVVYQRALEYEFELCGLVFCHRLLKLLVKMSSDILFYRKSPNKRYHSNRHLADYTLIQKYWNSTCTYK